MTNGGGQTLEVPITFAVAPPQTVPDYDIVGVELSQGVQRDTASARPGAARPRRALRRRDPRRDRGRVGASGVASAARCPPARIRVWVVAHGIRAQHRAAARAVGDASAARTRSRNGAVVRYGEAPLLSAPASVPVTPETGLSPALRADGAMPVRLPLGARRVGAADRRPARRRRASAATARRRTTSVTIRAPRVAISRMRPTNVTRVVVGGASAFVPDSAALLQAHDARPAALPVRAGRELAPRSAARGWRSDCATRRRRDGEPYRPNDRFFTDSSGPMTSLAPFVLGATPAGQVIVPAGRRPVHDRLLRAAQHAVVGAAGDAGERRADRRDGRGGHGGHARR